MSLKPSSFLLLLSYPHLSHSHWWLPRNHLRASVGMPHIVRLLSSNGFFNLTFFCLRSRISHLFQSFEALSPGIYLLSFIYDGKLLPKLISFLQSVVKILAMHTKIMDVFHHFSCATGPYLPFKLLEHLFYQIFSFCEIWITSFPECSTFN